MFRLVLFAVPSGGPPERVIRWPLCDGRAAAAWSGRRERDDRAVDDGAAGSERGALRSPVEPDDDPLIGEVLHVAEVRLQRPLAERHLPLGQVRVPYRAVAALGGVPAQHVQRGKTVEDGRVQALPVRVGGAGLAVGEGGQGGAR